MANDELEQRRGVRASESGRVPQWVLDEALGKPVEPVPFRAAPSVARARAQRRARGRRALVLLSVAAVVGTAALTVDRPGSGAGGFRRAMSGPSDAPPAGVGEAAAPLGRPPAAPARAEGDGYRFLEHQRSSSRPVTWSPCRAVHYVVRPDHAPPGGDALLHDAVAAVSAATGLRFVDDGSTTEAPSEDREPYQPERYGKRWAPVLVTWATSAEVPDFGIDVVGEAGPQAWQTAKGARAYVTGAVALDAAHLPRLPRRYALEVVEHELGHLVGLAHVDDRTQVMYPKAGGATAFGAGDLAGLRALGSGSCHKDL